MFVDASIHSSSPTLPFKELQPDNCSLICHNVLLWPSNQLSATTNLCKAHCVTCGGVLFSFHYVDLHLYNFLYEPLLLLIIFAVRPYHWLFTIATRGFISMNHYCGTSQQSRPGFSKPWFLCPVVQPDTT